ncbi:MAG: 16S rRNA (uracil(1498)-N(3))-methyltransferase [Armatimonadota bacterium]
MSRPRVFVSSTDISADTVSVTGADARHLGLVLRLRQGDPFTAIDEFGRQHRAVVTSVASDLVTGLVTEVIAEETEPRTRISVAQAVPKSAKMDLVVQKCTELGAVEVWPMMTERVVVSLDEERARDRRRRWQRVAKEAARQAGRTVIPEVLEIVSFSEALELANSRDLCLLFSEDESETSLRTLLGAGIRVETIVIFIGPEGGFSRNEVAAAEEAGALQVTLGPRVLRTETAAVVATALCLYELGELERRPAPPLDGA